MHVARSHIFRRFGHNVPRTLEMKLTGIKSIEPCYDSSTKANPHEKIQAPVTYLLVSQKKTVRLGKIVYQNVYLNFKEVVLDVARDKLFWEEGCAT